MPGAGVLPVPTALTVNLLQMPRPWQERSSGTASASLTFPLKIKVPGPEVLFRMKAMPEMAETVMQI